VLSGDPSGRGSKIGRIAQPGRVVSSLLLLLALGLAAGCHSNECRARLHWQGKAETFRVYGCPAPDCATRQLLSTVTAAEACRGEDCEITVATADRWLAVAAADAEREALSSSLPGCKPAAK